jgi:serine/threonine-protein kinase
MREYSEAIRFLQKAHSLAPRNAEITAALGYACARSGDRARARQLLADLHTLASRRRVSPMDFAILHTGLGQNEMALEYLEKGYQERDGRLIQLKVNPFYESLRGDPQFRNLLKRIGLDM